MTPFVHAAFGLVAVIAAAGWGMLLLGVLGRRRAGADPDRIFAYPLAGLALWALLGSVLWLTGGFLAPVAWLLFAGGLAAAAAGGHELTAAARAARPPRWGVGTWIWGAAVVLALPVLFAPDSSWDAGTFHLVLPREAAALGSLPLTVDHPFLFHMFTAHTLLGWGYLLAGPDGDVVGRTLMMALAGCALALATRRVGRLLHARIGLLAAALVLGTPVWIGQWGTALVDVQVFALAGAGATLCVWPGAQQRLLALGIALLATAAASKHLGVLCAIALAAGWVVSAARERRWQPLAYATALGLACVLAAGPWFVKNALAYGNPLALDVGGEAAATMAVHRLFPGAELTAPAFYGEPTAGSVGLRPFACVSRLASGFPWAMALSPLLLIGWLFALGGPRPPWWWGSWIASLLALAGFAWVLPSYESHSTARYFFAVSPFATLLAAVGLHRWIGASVWRARVVATLWIVVTLPFAGLFGLRAAARLPVLTGQQRPLLYWEERDAAAPLFYLLPHLMRPEDRVFLIAERAHLARVPRAQLVRAYQAHWAGVTNAAELRAAWDRWGITHVLVSDGPGERWDWGVQRDWVVGEASPALQGWRLQAENKTAQLYVRPEADPARNDR